MSAKTKKIDRRRLLIGSAKVGVALAVSSLAGYSSALSSAPSNRLSALPSDIADLNASQLSAAIKMGQVSCVEVMQAYLQRINRYNPVYNAIVGMPDQDDLMKQAVLADKALGRGEYWGWMHGMPHAVKDLSDVRGLINSSGSPIFKNNISKKDSIFVERIREQGALFIGKTNVPEFGLGSQTYNPVYGTTRNAYNPELIAGGSSGGASCALATHMVPVADGSDMMGSLRNPAAYNNIIGFRPSQGRVPDSGKDIFFQQLGYAGPMGRCVEDTIRLLDTMSGYDARAPMSLADTEFKFRPKNAADLKGYKVGWMGDYNGYLATEPGLLELCERALKHLAGEGLIVEDCMPDYSMERLWQTWLTLRHWTLLGAKPLYDNVETKKLLKPEAVWEIEGGLNLTGLDISTASQARSDWYRELHSLFNVYDFLVLPTAQVFPYSHDIHWPKTINGKAMDTYHRWMEVTIGGTLSGCPVINLPAGFDAQGRPMGLQFIGPMGADSELLEFALAYEASVDYLQRRPQLKDSIN